MNLNEELRRRLQIAKLNPLAFLITIKNDLVSILCQLITYSLRINSRYTDRIIKSNLFFWSKKIIKCKIDSFIIKCRIIDYFTTLDEVFKRRIYNFFEIKNDWIIFDIGASIGEFSLLSVKKCKNGRIIAIEPNKDLFDLLNTNIKLNRIRNIDSFNIGMSDKIDRILLYKNDLSYDSILDSFLGKKRDSYTVKSTTIDELVKILKLKKLDLIKIDTEGSELLILKGGFNTIKQFKPRMMVETHSKTLEKQVDLFFKKIDYKKVKELDIIKNVRLNYYQP